MYRFLMNRRNMELLFKIGMDGKKNMQFFCREVNVSPSHMTGMINQFVREQLVIKIPHVGRGQEYNIKFTDKGKELLELLAKYKELAERPLKKIEEESEVADQATPQDQEAGKTEEKKEDGNKTKTKTKDRK